MRNNVLLGVALLLLIFVISVRYIYSQRIEVFKESLTTFESNQYKDFKIEKERRLNSLSNGDSRILELFNENFNESTALIERDTLFSFMYLSDNIKYKTVLANYFDCLIEKCAIDKENEIAQNSIDKKVKAFERKYEQTFNDWYPKLKVKLLNFESVTGDCFDLFNDFNKISYEEEVWDEFENFIVSYDTQVKNEAVANKRAEQQFKSNVSTLRAKLNSNVVNFFNGKVSDKKSEILEKENVTKTFNAPILGPINYDVLKVSFNKKAFEEVADAAYEEHWKANSLGTGKMPYSSCYGSGNNCNDRNCSEIKVITGGSGDVLVTIKNSSRRVVRHAYVKGGNSFSFKVPDGSYQVFFYSGTGWNPLKTMSSSSCNSLRGGFVANENVTKDDYINLYSQIMTYELILQQQGNFSTKPSSKNEAF